MLIKATLLNVLATGFAQATSMLVIFLLAVDLGPAEFGILSVQLSAATLLSIVSTLQFERVYVRIKQISLAAYLGFHLRSLLIVTISLLVILLPFELGFISVILSGAIGLTQIALYAAARQGMFKRIWWMKAVQAVSLLTFSAAMYLLGTNDKYWFAFFASYLLSGLFVLDQSARQHLFDLSIKRDLRRMRYSFTIAYMALLSLLASSFTREFPVLIAGAMGHTATAGTLGLIMRVVGSPIGLLARSASAVVSNFVATRRFDASEMRKLLWIPLASALYILVVVFASRLVPTLSKYEDFGIFILALAPYFILRAYIGLLGPAIVYYKVQSFELLLNIIIVALVMASGILVYLDIINFFFLLTTMSVVSCVCGWAVLRRINIELRLIKM